jgi:uncharacterized protein YigE (DUF2233 family)
MTQRYVKKIWEYDAVYFDGKNAEEVIQFALKHGCYTAELEDMGLYGRPYIGLNSYDGWMDLFPGNYFVIREDGKKAKIVDGHDFDDDYSKSPYPS